MFTNFRSDTAAEETAASRDDVTAPNLTFTVEVKVKQAFSGCCGKETTTPRTIPLVTVKLSSASAQTNTARARQLQNLSSSEDEAGSNEQVESPALAPAAVRRRMVANDNQQNNRHQPQLQRARQHVHEQEDRAAATDDDDTDPLPADVHSGGDNAAIQRLPGWYDVCVCTLTTRALFIVTLLAIVGMSTFFAALDNDKMSRVYYINNSDTGTVTVISPPLPSSVTEQIKMLLTAVRRASRALDTAHLFGDHLMTRLDTVVTEMDTVDRLLTAMTSQKMISDALVGNTTGNTV